MNMNPLTKKIFNVFAGQALNESVIIRNQVLGQGLLSFLQLKDLILDTILADHAVGKNVLGLANPVGPVDGLLFNGRIPPGIYDIDIVCGGKV